MQVKARQDKKYMTRQDRTRQDKTKQKKTTQDSKNKNGQGFALFVKGGGGGVRLEEGTTFPTDGASNLQP